MAFYLDEQNQVAQTGSDQYAENREIGLARLILTPPSYTMSGTNALLKATWVTATKAAEPNRIKILKCVDKATPADIEPNVVERPFLGGKETYGGKNGVILFIDSNQKYHNELLKLNGNKFAGYIVDGNNNIKGISPDQIAFNPRQILTLKVLNRKTAEGVANEQTEIHVTFADIATGTAEIVNPMPTWSALTDIDSVHPVDIAVSGNWAATGGSWTVKYASTGRPVSGLVAADFVIPGKSVGTVSESTTEPGLYTCVTTSLTNGGTINLTVCASISLTSVAIESTGESTFVIP